METLILWLLVLVFAGGFLGQVATRVRLVAGAPNTFSFDHPRRRIARFALDVLLQVRTIRERPVAGLAHALVFWGFLAFGGYTAAEFLAGLRVLDIATTPWFAWYRAALAPFAVGVLAGIGYLAFRRVVVRPVGLGTTVSGESVVIAGFIATLMVTFLLGSALGDVSPAGRVNWWVHAIVVLVFLALMPSSKHMHLLLAPFNVLLKSPELGTVPNLDFERGEVGLEVVRDIGSKGVLDALTCVECGRCQVNCPAWGAGQSLNPKTLVLQTRQALVDGDAERPLGHLYSEEALWQCTTCGACENQCPVGIEHLPLIIGARRGLTSNGAAAGYLGPVYNHLDRRGNIWGLGADERQTFVESAGLEVFDRSRHDVLVWLGCAGSFEADHQQSLRSLFAILRQKGVRFGVLGKERCTGDPAKRTGNEYLFQELARSNAADLQAAAPTRILTSCPHCLKTIGDDYRQFGYQADVVHSSVFVEALTRDDRPIAGAGESRVTFHDPCYLGRYAGTVDEPRALVTRFGGTIAEPERNRDNPYCCGAGGGLLFATSEDAPGERISDIRLKQLQATGVDTVVTACPFCSIMLKGAQATTGAQTEFVDLMTYVNGRLTKADA
jgi:Fe-S oxidoreductase